eukprot:13966370-Alexandrium_andersonii.AAC.1
MAGCDCPLSKSARKSKTGNEPISRRFSGGGSVRRGGLSWRLASMAPNPASVCATPAIGPTWSGAKAQ